MADEHSNPHHQKRWLILGLLGIAQLMVVLDATIVNIALPSAQKELGFSDDSRQWIVTAYALAFGSLLLLGGRIGDLFGRKWTFIAGLAGFATASAIGGAAQSFEVLVGARALQGVFGAILAPSALSLLTTTFTDSDERAKAFGVFGGIAVSGAAVGLLLGGVLTEYLNWRWSMFVNIGFAIPTAIAALSLIKNVPHPDKPRLDIPGTLAASGGLFSLVYAVSNAETHSWGDTVTLVMFGVAAVLLTLFVWLQARVEHPLLPLRIVTDRTRAAAYLAVATFGMGMFGAFLFLTYYMQQTLGYSPITTGFAFLAMPLGIISTSVVASTRLLPRYGPRPLMLGGLSLATIGMLVLTGIGVEDSYFSNVLPGLLILGLGGGLVFAPSMATATARVDPADAGVASAMVNTSQQVSGSIGTALLAPSRRAPRVRTRARTLRLGAAVQDHAAVHGYTVAFMVGAAIFAGGAVVISLLLRGQRVEMASPQPERIEHDTGAQPALAH